MSQPEAAREAARQTDGRFGTQTRAEADIDLVGSWPSDMPASEELQGHARQLASMLPGGWSFDKMAAPPAGAVVITDVDQVGELTLEETTDGRTEAELRTADFHEFWTVTADEDGMRQVSGHAATVMARQWRIIDRDAAEDKGDDEMEPSDGVAGAGDEDEHLYTSPDPSVPEQIRAAAVAAPAGPWVADPAEKPMSIADALAKLSQEPPAQRAQRILESQPESYRAAATVTYAEAEAMRAGLTTECAADWSLSGFEPGGRVAIYEVASETNDVQVRVTPDSRGWHVDVRDEGDETDGWDDHFTGEEIEALSDQLNASFSRDASGDYDGVDHDDSWGQED